MNVTALKTEAEKIAHDLAEGMASESLGDPSKSLLPPHIQKQKIKTEIMQALNQHFLRLANGIQVLLTHMLQMSEAEEPVITKQVFEDILSKLDEKKTNELTDEELTALYSAAVDIYNSQQYESAADAFYVLTEFDPGQAIFWKSVGHARFHANQFKDAAEAYAEAQKVDAVDPENWIFQARCLEKEHRTQEAVDALMTARNLIAKHSEFEAWNDTVTTLIDSLKK